MPTKLLTEFTATLLSFDNGLVTGPKEIFLADHFYKVGTFEHLPRIIMDACKHEHATLLVESFMQAMNYF